MKRTGKQFNQAMARRIMLRDKSACIYCGSIATQIDHVIPASKDGPAITANGVASCAACNTKKKGKLSEEYLVKGLVYLARVGEDIGWVDDLYADRLMRLSYTQDYALRLLLQSELSHSEISFFLSIDEDMLDKIIEEMDS